MHHDVESRKPMIAATGIDPAMEREVRVATAAVLLEMANSDTDFAYDEAKTTMQLMQRAFGLCREDALNLIMAAKLLREATYSLEDFISILCLALSREERRTLLAMVHRVMIADGVVAGSEKRLSATLQQLLRLSDAEASQAFNLAVLASQIGELIENDGPYPGNTRLVYATS